MPNNKGSIYVKSGKSGVYLYSNKDGPKLPIILKNALTRGKGRWGDTPSLTRIIFSEMIQKDVFGTNSYAISPALLDNENFILVVDDVKSIVGIFGESGNCYAKYTYDQFISMPDAKLDFMKLTGYRFEQDHGINQRPNDPFPL